MRRNSPASPGDLEKLHGRQLPYVHGGGVFNSKREKRTRLHREKSLRRAPEKEQGSSSKRLPSNHPLRILTLSNRTWTQNVLRFQKGHKDSPNSQKQPSQPMQSRNTVMGSRAFSKIDAKLSSGTYALSGVQHLPSTHHGLLGRHTQVKTAFVTITLEDF